MKTLTTSTPIDPKTLTIAERDQLTEDLYRIHAAIFDGVCKAAFRKYVIESNSHRCRIYRYLNSQNETVGYVTFQQFVVTVGGRRQNIFRTEVGLLPAYRGHNAAAPLLFRESVKAYLRTLGRKAWFVATPIHPRPYRIAAKNLYEVYPRPGQQVPGKIQRLMTGISEALHLQAGQEHLSFQKQVGWITRQSPEQAVRLQASKCPLVRFYLAQNPSYASGTGMLMLIPFTLTNGAWMGSRFLGKALRKLTTRWFQRTRSQGHARPDLRQA